MTFEKERSTAKASADRVEITCKTPRAAKQRRTELDLDPATTRVPLAIVKRAAVIGFAVALHALSASAQTASEVSHK